jgi:hypothetical protein
VTRSAAGTAKIAIAGAGQVGVTLACACMIRDTGKTHRPVRPQRRERPGRGARPAARTTVHAHGHRHWLLATPQGERWAAGGGATRTVAALTDPALAGGKVLA